MQRVFAVLANLLVVALGTQFFLAGMGAFNTAPNDTSFLPHRVLGFGIVLFTALLTILAALARLPGRLIGLTGLITGLVVGQILIGVAADAFNTSNDTTTTASTLIFGLHAINGLAIIALAGIVARRALALSRGAMLDPQTGGGSDIAGPGQPMT